MSKPIPIDENLLAKYLSGEASNSDFQQIEEWLDADTAHVLELDRYRKLWDTQPTQVNHFEPDVTLAWQKVAQKINNPKYPVAENKNHFLSRFSMAASVILLVGLGFYFYVFKEKATVYQTIVSHKGGLEKLLADSSKIFLNEKAILEYPEQFTSHERRVKLKGEAFFEIKPNAKKPFNVEIDQLNIRVLGTSFNINEDSVQIAIIVRTGKVEVTASNNKSEILTPGNGLIYNKKARSFLKTEKTNPSEFAYFNKIFVFENTNLAEVSRLLSKGYHAKISLGSKDLSQLAITTKFENISLPEALQIISETLQLNLISENNNYIFVKK